MTATPPGEAQVQEPSSPNKMVEGLHKELECVICNAVMIDPRVLDCQHAMCLRCIFGIVKRDRGNGVTIVCPFHCEERTRTKSDVRSLKRNPMIGNLCVSVRERDFKNRIHDCCDWCDKALWEKAETSAEAEPVFCSRCGAISCQTCSNDRRCDHAYLCGGLRAEGGAGVPVRVLPMLMSADMCLGEVVKDFDSRVTEGCSALDRKTFEQLELNMGLAPAAPDVAYVVGTQVDVDVEAGGKSGVFTVTLLPPDEINANRDLERHMVCHSCVTPSDMSPEVTNLNEVSSATEALSLRIATIRRCAGALARTMGKRGTVRAVARATLAIAQGADAVMSVVQATTLKRLRRLILVSHLLNIPHIERLAERTTHAADETAKESMHRSLITQVKLALSLSNRVYSSLDALIEEVEACTAETSDLVLRCIEVLREEAPVCAAAEDHMEALAQLQGISAVQGTIEACTRDVLDVDARLGAYVGLLFDSLMNEVPMEGEQRLSFEDLTAKVKQSSGHVRIVASTWTTVASIAASIDCLPPDVAVEPLSIPDPMSEEQETVLNGVDELVDSLCPQIFDFRRQHFEMMESSPEQTHANRQVLLDQLSSLILQALDLFFKEELMRSQAQASLFSRVRAFERAVEEKSAALHRMLEPESAAADGALLETIRETGFTMSVADDGSAIVCARSANFAANNVPPRRIGLDDAAAITKAALCFASEEGGEPRRVLSVTASAKGAQVLAGRLITSSITQHSVPVSLSTPSFVLCDDLRARAQRLAKRAFSAIHPKEKNVKAQIVSMNASSVILVPVVYDSLRLTPRAPGLAGMLARPLRGLFGLNVMPEYRESPIAAVEVPAAAVDPTAANPAAEPAAETEAGAGTNSVSVQTTPPPEANRPGLSWKRVGSASLWHVRYIVDAASGTIVQEPLPSIPVYESVDRIGKLLQRPIVFAGIASAITATVVTLRVGIWAVRAGTTLIEVVKASNAAGQA